MLVDRVDRAEDGRLKIEYIVYGKVSWGNCTNIIIHSIRW